ncbi:MAG TPA: CvpA family protein [Croceibacterium sp.]|jgi:membrane protein required for colicin V production
MTVFDIIVLVVVGVAAIGGFMRGFVQEVLSLAAWILAVAAIHYLHTDLTAFIASFIGTPTSAAMLAFALLLLIPYAAMKLIAGRVGQASRRSIIGPIDRALGFGFGTVKGVIIVVIGFSLLVLGYDTVWGQDGRPEWITNARTYPFVNAASDEMVQLIKMRQQQLQKDDATVHDDG